MVIKSFEILAAIIVLLLSIVLVLVVGFYSWQLISAVSAGAKTLAPEIYVPLTVTVFTATVGLFAALFTQNRVRKRELEAAYRERKIEIYLDFLKTIESLFLSQRAEFKDRALDTEDLVLKIADVRTKAVLWGSSGVLRELSKLTKLKGDLSETMSFLENIQREIRKDLGLSNRGLDRDFFVTLILNDASDIEKIRANSSSNPIKKT